MSKQTLSTLRTILVLTFFLLLGLAIAFAYRPAATEESRYGSLGGDFTLQSATGEVSLADFKGKVVALYIGYASCPDVCPTALAVTTQAFNELSETEQQSVAGVFVSVDPDRDTPERLATYVQFFSPLFTGLTGSREAIDQVVKQYGAFYRMVEMKDSAMGYAVDHSSRIYLIDQQGNLVKTLLHNTSPAQVLTEIRALLGSNK
ncbi:SCO family protein [Neptunomonas marina]|uniref:SCO family protein n=1 Tax=Neptunomonas marina TaxID=1815562 RepID=A0A437Q9L0_9GAMM|nr:SCO family protein [Neptunomonas marina]RVU31127.1 SCO family protein [Neptunomonas marina]